MDEITTFLMTFEKEVNTYQRLISEKKEELKLHTADNKSLKQLGVYEQEVSDLKIFINLVQQNKDFWMGIKDVSQVNLDLKNENASGMISDFVDAQKDILNTTFDINREALEIAEKIIEGLDLSVEVKEYDGIKGFVIQKITEEVVGLCDKFIPYWGEIQMVLDIITPEANKIPKAKLENSTAVDMRKVLLYGKAETLDATILLTKTLEESHSLIDKNEALSDIDKYIKFDAFYEILKISKEKLTPDPGFFTKQVDKTLYMCLQELFAKCNTTVVQVCEYTAPVLDGYALNKEALLKTKFSNDEGINKHILDILAKMNVAVSGGKIETKVLQKVFPNTNIVYKGPKDNDPVSLDKDNGANPTAMDKLQHNEQQTIGTQYAGNRAAMLDRDAQRRAEKKELLALRPKAEELGIDKAAIKEATLAELKQMIEDKQAQKDRKIKLEKNIKSARKYGVPENVIETLVEANASAEQFYAAIRKTDKYEEQKRLKAEQEKQLDDKNVDFDQGDKNKIPLSKIDLELNKLYILANHFSISSRGEHGYEKRGGINLENYSTQIKAMAERIALTDANHLVFRCSFVEEFHKSVVEQVCDHLTESLRHHMKVIKGKGFEKLSYEISSIKRGSGKEMVGYFILLKKQ